MNKVILIGRLAADPEVKYMQNEKQTAVARYRLAVDRRFHKEGEQAVDFISCVAFGKNGEFAEKYLSKGMKIAVVGRITTGSYEKDGQKVYTTDVVVEEHEFCEGKASNGMQQTASQGSSTGFTAVPATDDDLPF